MVTAFSTKRLPAVEVAVVVGHAAPWQTKRFASTNVASFPEGVMTRSPVAPVRKFVALESSYAMAVCAVETAFVTESLKAGVVVPMPKLPAFDITALRLLAAPDPVWKRI